MKTVSSLLLICSCLALGMPGTAFTDQTSGLEADTPPSLTEETSLNQNSSLEEYIQYILLHNPALKAAHQSWEAARLRAASADKLPDPRISYAYYIEAVQTKTGPQEQKAGISQKFPMFGKRALDKAAAEHGAEAFYARYRATRANTIFQFKTLWFETYYLGRMIETSRARKKLFQSLKSQAETSVENGGNTRDLLDIRITLAQIEDGLQTFQTDYAPLQARLNALLNRDNHTPVPFPTDLPTEDLRDDEVIRSISLKNSPDIEEQQAILARTQARETLAKRNWLPDITLGTDWIQTGDDGDDPLIASISVNLPIWFEANRDERHSTRLEQAAQTNRLQDHMNSIQALLTDSFTRRNNARRRADFFTAKLIPPAEQHFELTRTAYENGTADLQELTASEERLLNLQLNFERFRTDQAITEAEIEKWIGGDTP